MGERTRRPGGDAFFAPPASKKSSHALESPSSKLGSILLLLAISSVAAVGVLLPDEDDPLAAPANAAKNAVKGTPPKLPPPRIEKRPVPITVAAPRNTPQHAYAVAYELAKQRVTTVSGLTRQQRLEATREALARIQGSDVSRLTVADRAALAGRAPEPVKSAALRGVTDGETAGISTQSQLLLERMLSRESRSEQQPAAP